MVNEKNKALTVAIPMQIFVPSVLIMIFFVLSSMLSFVSGFKKVFGNQIRLQNSDAFFLSSFLIGSFMNGFYVFGQELADDERILCMDGGIQDQRFDSTVQRTPCIEFMYCQDMNGNQTSCSSGTISNRKVCRGAG